MKCAFYLFISLAILVSCRPGFTPKPESYPRAEMPLLTGYNQYTGTCPFTFKYPSYATVVKDGSPGADSCWLNFNVPKIGGIIHLSYKTINSPKDLRSYAEDAHTFAYKHSLKAEDIVPSRFNNAHGVSGLIYDIEGNTASSLQFFVTDSAHHYLRGSVYINAHPNKDSLGPALKFLNRDVDTLLATLRWK